MQNSSLCLLAPIPRGSVGGLFFSDLDLWLDHNIGTERKINELVKQLGEWKDDDPENLRKVLCVPRPYQETRDQKKYATIKLRRIELCMPLDVSSKLDRSRSHIEELMRHGAEQARQLLDVIPSQITLEAAWNETLRDKQVKA